METRVDGAVGHQPGHVQAQNALSSFPTNTLPELAFEYPPTVQVEADNQYGSGGAGEGTYFGTVGVYAGGARQRHSAEDESS